MCACIRSIISADWLCKMCSNRYSRLSAETYLDRVTQISDKGTFSDVHRHLHLNVWQIYIYKSIILQTDTVSRNNEKET